MIAQIMVPLDGSELAERALPCAAQLAAASGASLHLVQVFVPLPYRTGQAVPLSYDDQAAAEQQAAKVYLETVRTPLAAADRSVDTTLLAGYPAAALLDYCAAVPRTVRADPSAWLSRSPPAPRGRVSGTDGGALRLSGSILRRRGLLTLPTTASEAAFLSALLALASLP